MKTTAALLLIALVGTNVMLDCAYAQQNSTWRYYTTGNTGIQGDYVDAVWIDHDGDPYIAGYTPGWEEGGFAKLIQAENRWINYSNLDYPVIGSISDVGASRISDIEEDADGILWMATWRGLLKFNPSAGASSLQFWGVGNSPHPGGRTRDLAIAPDGSVWGAVVSVVWGNGGLVQYNPRTNIWRYWGYGTSANNWPADIPYAEHVSIQKKPNGGYRVWAQYISVMIVFDSDTQLFTRLPGNGAPGNVLSLPGRDCVDESNTLWAVRYLTASTYSLDYLTEAGVWVRPPQPPIQNLYSGIWAFKAYGDGKALVVDPHSVVWQFNGSSWQNLGAWKDGAFSSCVTIDNQGNVWASGTGGAAKRNAQTGMWQRYRITNSSQIDYFVRDISLDSHGNVWLTGNAGSGFGGMQKFDGVRWTGFNGYTYGLGHDFPFQTDNADAIYWRPSNGSVVVNPMFNYLHAWNGSNFSSLNYQHDRSKGLVEDSHNRLWSLGEYYHLKYYANNTWTAVPFSGWGARICKDPTRPGTVLASSGVQVLRTDGTYRFSRSNTDFPELNPQSDLLTTVAADVNGVAWVGSNKGLFRVNAETGSYQFFSPGNSLIPGDNIMPLAVTPDGRVWFTNFQSTSTSVYGLGWYDGTNFGMYPQRLTGGLPHAQISDIEVRTIPGGYELWISSLSRGIAVLTIEWDPVAVSQEEVPGRFVLHQNYPNPFNPSTTIQFSIPQRSVVKLTIYDILGRELATLVREEHDAGAFSVNFDASLLASGSYFYRLEAGSFVQTKKMLLMR